MDSAQSGYAFTGMDELPVADDDDIVVTVGRRLPDAVHVEAVAPLTLFVRFDDGVQGTVRFEQTYLNGVWELLRDPAYFRKVGLRHGAVSWPNETPDMCPDTMHDEIVRHGGEWILN